jgi:hypothetical protein
VNRFALDVLKLLFQSSLTQSVEVAVVCKTEKFAHPASRTSYPSKPTASREICRGLRRNNLHRHGTDNDEDCALAAARDADRVLIGNLVIKIGVKRPACIWTLVQYDEGRNHRAKTRLNKIRNPKAQNQKQTGIRKLESREQL